MPKKQTQSKTVAITPNTNETETVLLLSQFGNLFVAAQLFRRI
jgi:hypothetical protein